MRRKRGGDGLPRVDVDRVTASVTYHRRLGAGNLWASTLAWGRNEESGVGSRAILLESSLTRAERDAWFGRFEVGGKSAHDLHVHELNEHRLLTVGKLQAGYTRYFASAAGLRLGVGGLVSVGCA